MSCHQPVIAAALLAAAATMACGQIGGGRTSPIAGTVTLVNRVSADVRCVNGATCEPTLKTTLRERLGSVAISFQPDRHAVDLEFEQTASAFSSASFRQAVVDGGGEVSRIGIEACGRVEMIEGTAWITTGSTRLLIEGPAQIDSGAEMCVTGELRDQVNPPRIVPGKLAS